MTEAAALQRLLTWLSPAFPVGAFAWSAGIETVIAERRVLDAPALEDWIGGSLEHGGLRTDSIILAHAHRAESAELVTPPSPPLPARGRVSAGGRGSISPSEPDGTSPLAGEDGRGGAVGTSLAYLADLCLALTPAAERTKESLLTGDAFVTAAKAWPSEIYARLPAPCPYPIAVGAIAAAHGIGRSEALLGYLTATVHSQISVAIRLVPLGQTDGLRVMAALEGRIGRLAAAALAMTLDDIGSIGYAADIAQMRHETLEPRIFRS